MPKFFFGMKVIKGAMQGKDGHIKRSKFPGQRKGVLWNNGVYDTSNVLPPGRVLDFVFPPRHMNAHVR